VTLHDDNAPVHYAMRVSEKVSDERFIRLVHPPYSPDRAPCDLSLFEYLRE
jgi:hypothetical protein